MIIHDVVQRSSEWAALRLGRLTSSRACDMLATIKSGEAAARRNLRVQLALERITGRCQENGYVSKEMERGAALECEAVAAYEAETGQLLSPIGFLAHDELLAGCSPDAMVGDIVGCVELKCPKAAIHLEYWRTETIPKDYAAQIQHILWISGAAWCDFVSYQPEFPAPLRLKITRVEASEIDFKAYELLVRMFLADVDREVEAIRQLAAAVAV